MQERKRYRCRSLLIHLKFFHFTAMVCCIHWKLVLVNGAIVDNSLAKALSIKGEITEDSYVEWRHIWQTSVLNGVAFSFRRTSTNGCLAYICTKRDIEIAIHLVSGSIWVAGTYNDHRFNISRMTPELAEDQWHRLVVRVNTALEQVRVQVGREWRQVISVKAAKPLSAVGKTAQLHLGCPRERVGGDRSFVGCVREAAFIDGDEQVAVVREFRRQGAVQDGCFLPVTGGGCVARKCEAGGLCLAEPGLGGVVCDCYGTGRAGKYCEQPAPSTAGLVGDGWITVMLTTTGRTVVSSTSSSVGKQKQAMAGDSFGLPPSKYNKLGVIDSAPSVMDDDNRRFLSDNQNKISQVSTEQPGETGRQLSNGTNSIRLTRIALQFKTVVSEGVLVSSVSVWSHLMVYLQAGTVYVTLSTSGSTHYTLSYIQLGHDLNDNVWHSVTLVSVNNMLLVSVDNSSETMPAGNFFTHLPSQMSFGGGHKSVMEASPEEQTSRNLVGCLREIYVNELSLLDTTTGLVRQEGSVLSTCQALAAVPVMMTHPGAMWQVKLPQLSSGSRAQFELDFRTMRGSGVLLSHAVNTSLGQGVIRIQLSNGQVVLTLFPLENFTVVNRSVRIEGNVSDGQWHSLKALLSSGSVQLQVDDKQMSLSSPWKFKTEQTVVFGSTSLGSLIGCLRNIRIRNFIINPVEHVYGGCTSAASQNCQSSHVTVGQCQLTDWCMAIGSPCLNGGQCVSGGSNVHCLCPINYTGNNCQLGLEVTSTAAVGITNDRWTTDASGSATPQVTAAGVVSTGAASGGVSGGGAVVEGEARKAERRIMEHFITSPPPVWDTRPTEFTTQPAADGTNTTAIAVGVSITLVTLAVIMAVIAVLIKCHPCRKSYGVMNSSDRQDTTIISYTTHNSALPAVTVTSEQQLVPVTTSRSMDSDVRPPSEDDGEETPMLARRHSVPTEMDTKNSPDIIESAMRKEDAGKGQSVRDKEATDERRKSAGEDAGMVNGQMRPNSGRSGHAWTESQVISFLDSEDQASSNQTAKGMLTLTNNTDAHV